MKILELYALVLAIEGYRKLGKIYSIENRFFDTEAML
jgi:hypothetical protein